MKEHKKVVVRVTYICDGKLTSRKYTYRDCSFYEALNQCRQFVSAVCNGNISVLKMEVMETS